MAKGGLTLAPTKQRNLTIVIGLSAALAVAIGARFFFATTPSRPTPRIKLSNDGPVVRNPVVGAAPAPDAPPEAPATATFEFSARASGYQASFYVLGWVTNTSPFALDHPQVVAVLLDAQGKEVDTANGYTTANDLDVGEKSPILILINKPPPHESLRYEVVVRKATYRRTRAGGLKVEPATPARSTFGKSWDVSGKVFNEGKDIARFIQVTILAYDDKDVLIGISPTYARGSTELVPPGESARFSAIGIFPGTTPARFEFRVEATTAQK